MACRICNDTLVLKWSLKVYQNKYSADYFECVNCHSLQITNPFWLKESYEDEDLHKKQNLDSGRFRRNFSAYSYLNSLVLARCMPSNPLILDYGGGYGLLTQMLVDGGYNACMYDPHVSSPFLSADRHVQNIESFNDYFFDVIVALEIFEHLVNPLEIGASMIGKLKKNGALIISTNLYKPDIHDKNWSYLAREAGQHITFWTRKAIEYFATRFSFNSVGYFPSTDGFLIIFSPLIEHELHVKLGTAMSILKDPNFRSFVTKNWDFLNINILSENVMTVSANRLNRNV